jgi:hypothetical protein
MTDAVRPFIPSIEKRGMTLRRTILSDLHNRHKNGDTGYIRPTGVPGFTVQPSQYQVAINQLLSERLLNGSKDSEGRLVIALNAGRLADVQKELQPWFLRLLPWPRRRV